MVEYGGFIKWSQMKGCWVCRGIAPSCLASILWHLALAASVGLHSFKIVERLFVQDIVVLEI